MKREKNLLIPILIGAAVIIALVLSFFFLIKPAVNNYTLRMQGQGYAIAVYSLMQQASTCNVVPLYAGNITMNIVWTDCLKQAPAPSTSAK
ncbi:MAG TPA: hypothetical protein VMC80_02305 [Patescibacteria group bacterium]|nr:hypothetical protein [Patescibacteria group bacterium]